MGHRRPKDGTLWENFGMVCDVSEPPVDEASGIAATAARPVSSAAAVPPEVHMAFRRGLPSTSNLPACPTARPPPCA
eukprot:362917-Chlamydomonas_euryale.AAC.3